MKTLLQNYIMGKKLYNYSLLFSIFIVENIS